MLDGGEGAGDSEGFDDRKRAHRKGREGTAKHPGRPNGKIAAAYGLLWFYKPNLSGYWSFLCLVASNFVFERKARGHASTLRELVYGDPNAERQRLIEKLHLAMLQETDPEVRHAYAESIAALKRELPTGSRVVE